MHQLNGFDINEGISVAEESIGTNAIAISMKLKKAVYTLPQHHYCDFLRALHIYCSPLWANGKMLSYLAIITFEKSIKKEMLAITDLLRYQIINEFKNYEFLASSMPEKSYIRLSDSQLSVLKLLAKGLTDKAAGIESGLSFDTIKYHKKNIFKKLDAKCTLEAVMKALKLNLFSLDEIDI
jgi:DNA-binding CsgD family transcriptional regulator